MKFSLLSSTPLTGLLVATTSMMMAQAQVPVDTATQCVCPEAEFDERDCFIYANSGGGLVAYPVAQVACINDIEAGNDYMLAQTFWRVCPYPNETGFIVPEFINYLRDFTEAEAAQFAMSQFIENMDYAIFSNETGMYQLTDPINNNIQGLQFNCSENSSELGKCWDQVSQQVRDRYPRHALVCQEWHAQMEPRLRDEQARARRILCQGGLNETQLEFCEDLSMAVSNASDCGSLSSQVPPSQAVAAGVPVCGQDDEDEDGSAAVMSWKRGTWATLFLAAVMALNRHW